jgi:putative transposase
MILSYKILHSQDFSQELEKARKIAEYAIKYRSFSSKSVKYIGLKSAIANQILRKYGRNKNIKRIMNVKLIIPNQSIKVNRITRTITVPCLKDKFRDLEYRFPNTFEKINQIEIGEEYAYVSITFKEKEPNLNIINNVIGIDLNTTGHVAVVSNPQTGKVWKFGKAAEHIHKKYKNIRRRLQKLGKYKKVKQIKNRESRIVKDINHKISKEIVKIAHTNNCGIIKLEKLQNIKQNKKHSKSFRYCLNSWSFYQFKVCRI